MAHGVFITDYLGNEASAVSINHGAELLLVRRVNSPSMRANQDTCKDVLPGPMQRLAHTSADCGRTWSRPFLVDISGVHCHSTLARVGRRLLFAIPNGLDLSKAERQMGSERQRGAVYFSDDEGRTWCHKVAEAETFSYSTVGPLKGSQYITLFARNSMGQNGVGCRVLEDGWLSAQS